MDDEDIKNIIKNLTHLNETHSVLNKTHSDLLDLHKNIVEKLVERVVKLEAEVNELKRTDIKPKKKRRRNTIGVKVLDGGKKEQPPFATQPSPA
jgi:hypothetical protein